MISNLDDCSRVQALLEGANRGSDEARAALVECSCRRLLGLARRMLHRHFPELRRWEDSDDVMQQAWLRLHRSLEKIKPGSVREFYRLAATEIRWELIDLCRRHFGPQGIGKNHQSDCAGAPAGTASQPLHELADDTNGPTALIEWSEFHELVGTLPDDEREVFDLLWYQQLSQEEAAAVLGVSLRTVKRRWQRAKLQLYKAGHGQRPG